MVLPPHQINFIFAEAIKKYTMKRIFNITASLLFSLASFAQNSEIKGIIYASDSLTPLDGVTINIEKTSIVTLSNSIGEYSFHNLDSGQHFLLISHPGYKKVKISIILSENNIHEQNIYLTEEVMDLPEIMVKRLTLTGGEMGIKDLPGSAYYLSPKELDKFNYSDINKTLRSIPGVNIQEEDGFGLRPNIGLRGTGVERSSKITIMEDGILIAPAPYCSPAAYYFPTIGRMQAVEILKGSSQIKYGPFTTGGAINLISTQIPSELRAKINLMGGSFGSQNLHVFIGNSQNQIGYSVEAFQYSADGFKSMDNEGNTGFDKKDLLAKFRINSKPTAKIYQSLSFKAGMSAENSNDTYLGITQDDFNSSPYNRYFGSQMDRMKTEQSQLSVSYLARLTKFMTITSTVYRNDFHRNWYKLDGVKDTNDIKPISISKILLNPEEYAYHYDVITGKTSLNDDALYVKGNNRTYYSQGIQTILGFDLKTGAIKHDIDLGFRYHQDNMDRFQYEDQYKMDDKIMMLTNAGAPGTESNRIANAIAAATYVQYKFSFKRFTATTGIRHEHIILQEKDYGKNDPGRTGNSMVKSKNTVDVFIPGLSTDFKINSAFTAFAGAHKGFAPPGTNQGSSPEESINYETGLKFFKKSLSSQFVFFLNDYKNLLGTDLAATGGTGSGDLYNGGSALSKGIEFQLIYDLASNFKKNFNLPITIGYTYTDAQFRSDFNSTFEDWGTVNSGDALPYLANHQFSVNASFEHAKFAINLGSKYTSEMRTIAGTGSIAPEELIPSFFVMDFGAKYHIHKNISLAINMTNLTNNIYLVSTRPAGLRPGMPRAIQLGIKASF